MYTVVLESYDEYTFTGLVKDSAVILVLQNFRENHIFFEGIVRIFVYNLEDNADYELFVYNLKAPERLL